jgi:hypothetical protein
MSGFLRTFPILFLNNLKQLWSRIGTFYHRRQLMADLSSLQTNSQ